MKRRSSSSRAVHDVLFGQIGDGLVLVDDPFGAERAAAAASSRACDDGTGVSRSESSAISM